MYKIKMNMNISNLNESELLKLKVDIDKQIEIIVQEKIDSINRSKNGKTKICELTNKDTIFGIEYSPHTNEIYKMKYFHIGNYTIVNNSDYHNISVGGLSTSIHKNYYNKHYFFVQCCYSLYFFTMKPETWENDLQYCLLHEISNLVDKYDKEISNLKYRILQITESKDKINEFIQNNKI